VEEVLLITVARLVLEVQGEVMEVVVKERQQLPTPEVEEVGLNALAGAKAVQAVRAL
jgi:hypothetical protein